MNCYICKEEIPKRHLGIHLRVCRKKNNLEESLDEIKFKQFGYFYGDIFSEELVIEHYINNKKSILAISDEFNISYDHIVFLLKYFNITKRTLKEESNNKNTRIKYKETCIHKYNVDNVSKSKQIKDKKKETFLNNYGVDNIYKDKAFKEWIKNNNFAWNTPTEEENKQRVEKQTNSIKKFWRSEENKEYTDKLKNENKLKYREYLDNLSEDELKELNRRKTKWWGELTDEQKSAIFRKRAKSTSKLESKISDILISLNISFTTQKYINKKIFDFHITKTKILIEVNGDYWHANPKLYESKDLLSYPGGEIRAMEIWNNDLNKKIIAEDKGYNVIYIWESEILKRYDWQIAEMIWQKLNL